MNYKLKENAGATGLTRGKVYTAKQIDDLPGMGGVQRLLQTGAIEETSEAASTETSDAEARAAENVTGNPPPLSKEEGKEEEARVQRHGGEIGDAAEKSNPPSGQRGTVQRSKPGKEGDAR
jgi:hypothetical protein